MIIPAECKRFCLLFGVALVAACQFVSGGAELDFDREPVLEPSCIDQEHNGDETDADCGGSCASCTTGRACLSASDCQSRFCHIGDSGGDAADGGGGAGGAAAAVGACAPCQLHSDCESDRQCDASGNCVARKEDGAHCDAPEQCLSGFCPIQDGVCCDKPCTGTCEACIKVKSKAPTGTCTTIPAGLDPDNDCAPHLCRGLTASCATSCASDAECARSHSCDEASSACVP